jgi:hypothetical protein
MVGLGAAGDGDRDDSWKITGLLSGSFEKNKNRSFPADRPSEQMEVDAEASASSKTETRIVFGGQYEAGAGTLSLIMLPAEVLQQVSRPGAALSRPLRVGRARHARPGVA